MFKHVETIKTNNINIFKIENNRGCIASGSAIDFIDIKCLSNRFTKSKTNRFKKGTVNIATNNTANIPLFLKSMTGIKNNTFIYT